MKRECKALLGGVLCGVLYTFPAQGMEVGAYAVADHTPCGVGDLPATTREMEQFFADDNFSTLFERNFYHTDRMVKQMEWAGAGDYAESDESANGYNGVDASAVSYIASHGVTSSDVYRASMGSSSFGGCDARSDGMLLGDQSARYLILSTCQGVKIGSGENPSRPGANPSRTWNPDRVNGLNCIFGYSNNMADASQYGTLLIDYVINNDEPVADSFMRAGRAVASFNIPAVICFGATEDEAQSRIMNDMELSTTAAEGGASAYVYENSRELVDSKIQLGKARVNHVAVSKVWGFPTPKVGKASLLTHNAKAGTVTYRKEASYKTTAMYYSDEEAIALARDYVAKNNLAQGKALTAVRIVDRGLARGLEEPQIIGKTVVFAQEMFGMHALSTAGTLEVYVDGTGEVAGFHFALRDVTGSLADSKTAVTASVLDQNIASVLSMYEQRYPQADAIQLYTDSLGYDLGADAEMKSDADLVHQVVVEVTHGDYGRRYIENVLLP